MDAYQLRMIHIIVRQMSAAIRRAFIHGFLEKETPIEKKMGLIS